MFLDSSRYAQVAQDDTTTQNGRAVTAIKLRALPPVRGSEYSVNQNDRLDLLAQDRYADGTRFWHIADANTALQAGELTADTGAALRLPET